MAYDVLVLQSLHEKGYDEAVKGVRRECQASMRTVVLSDYAEMDITRIMREEHPRLIIAVGDRALAVAEKQRNTPVLYMMALNPKPRQKDDRRQHAARSGKVYLRLRGHRAPRGSGVVYDPARSGAYVKRAQAAARRSGIDLVAREVHAPKETPAMLRVPQGEGGCPLDAPRRHRGLAGLTEAYFLFSQSETGPRGQLRRRLPLHGGRRRPRHRPLRHRQATRRDGPERP